MTTTVIGIDNGLTGGCVALSATPGGGIISKLAMPLRSKSKGNEVDISAVWTWISQFNLETLCVVIETPGKHSPGLLALCSMWDSYGALRAMCELKALRHHRISPQAWQKVMLPGCAKGNTKPFAKSVASSLWPAEKWLATPRCSVPHDGLIDAAIIAEYGRLKLL